MGDGADKEVAQITCSYRVLTTLQNHLVLTPCSYWSSSGLCTVSPQPCHSTEVGPEVPYSTQEPAYYRFSVVAEAVKEEWLTGCINVKAIRATLTVPQDTQEHESSYRTSLSHCRNIRRLACFDPTLRLLPQIKLNALAVNAMAM
jgi:hypothetical protein